MWQNERARRSTFFSSLFGVATDGDLQIANNEIKRTQGMMTFLLSHKSAFPKNIESLMEGEESLSARNQELSGLLYKQIRNRVIMVYRVTHRQVFKTKAQHKMLRYITFNRSWAKLNNRKNLIINWKLIYSLIVLFVYVSLYPHPLTKINY